MLRLAKVILINILIIICLITLMELFFLVSVRYPAVHRMLPGIITKISRRIFFYYDMNSIQFFPPCARFDPEVGYTLRPGKCVFADHEFSTKYSINSLGVRDTEEALHSPPLIVVGDSYAMGWGVEQNDTFPKIIEARTGVKVLNISCASYGTAREMLMLKSADRSRMKYLIIQYCDNDYEENLSFLESGNKLVTMSREAYNRAVQRNTENLRYYPGKYLWAAAHIISHNFDYLFKVGKYQEIEGSAHRVQKGEVAAFLGVLLNCGIDFSGVQILVFKANSFDPRDLEFAESLKKKIDAGSYPPFIKRMIIMDAGKYLNERTDIFLMNGHYNLQGNQKIAKMIIRHLGKL